MNYGYDLYCLDDLTQNMKEIDGNNNIQIVIQSIFRRLNTPRGGLIYDPDYGLDVKGFLHKGMKATDILSIPGQIQAEILKDDRVETATVKILSADPLEGILKLDIQCETADEPFKLVLSISNVKAEIVK